MSHEICERVANVPPYLRKTKDPLYVDAPILTVKLVDDELNVDKVNMKTVKLLRDGPTFFRNLHADRTEALLEHIAMKACVKGIDINEKKTGLMCVSAAIGFEPRVHVKLNGQEIKGTKSMKILGFTLDSDYGFRTHVNNVTRAQRLINLEIPVLIRSLKSSNVELG